MDNKQDLLRDPIWQFISAVVGVVATFIGFLTLSPSAQGVALVGIAIACFILIFVFGRKLGGLPLILVLFLFIWVIWSCLISGLTYNQVPFFVNNFGLVNPGVIYAKSDIGLALLIIEYILCSITGFLLLLDCLISRNYIMMISVIFLFIFTLYGSIPALYVPNFSYMRLLLIDWVRPKTILGGIISFGGILGYILLFISIYMNRHLLIKDRDTQE